jgi:hypothetical protein
VRPHRSTVRGSAVTDEEHQQLAERLRGAQEHHDDYGTGYSTIWNDAADAIVGLLADKQHLQAELDALKEAAWDAYRILGFDTDGAAWQAQALPWPEFIRLFAEENRIEYDQTIGEALDMATESAAEVVSLRERLQQAEAEKDSLRAKVCQYERGLNLDGDEFDLATVRAEVVSLRERLAGERVWLSCVVVVACRGVCRRGLADRTHRHRNPPGQSGSR